MAAIAAASSRMRPPRACRLDGAAAADHHGGRAGILHQERRLGLGQLRRGRQGHEPGRQRAEIDEDVIGLVAHPDHHPVAGLEPETEQARPRCRAPHGRPRRSSGCRRVAVPDQDQRGLVGTQPRVLGETVPRGVEAGGGRRSSDRLSGTGRSPRSGFWPGVPPGRVSVNLRRLAGARRAPCRVRGRLPRALHASARGAGVPSCAACPGRVERSGTSRRTRGAKRLRIYVRRWACPSCSSNPFSTLSSVSG